MPRIMVLLFFFVCTPLAAGSQSAQLPSVAVLQAKIDAAIGLPPPSRYERIRSLVSGVAETEQNFHAGDDYRENDVFGPLQTAGGRYQKQAWHQNANGQTVLDQADPGNAVEERFVTTVARVNSPFDAYVIARLNNAGSGTKEYIDPSTSRIVRRERLTPTETIVTAYDDFRTVAGYTIAWHWTRRDGHPENDSESWVESLVARPIAPSEIDIASPRRELVEFPTGKTSVELPVQMVDDKFIVRVMIGTRGLDFELDSGAGGIFLEEDVAKQLGLTSIMRRSNAMNAGRISEASVIAAEMRVGDLRMHDVAIWTVPGLPEQQLNGVKVVGLLGFDFIAELGLRLDYDAGRVTAMRPDVLPALDAAGTNVLNVRLGMEVPFTDVTINGALGERFTIDTGGGGTLMIADYFARRYPQALVDRGGGSGRNARFNGVGGAIDIRPYQLATVQVGSVKFLDFVGYRVKERKSYGSNGDGFIGTDLLRYFTVWLDYGDSRIYLVPNKSGRRSMH